MKRSGIELGARQEWEVTGKSVGTGGVYMKITNFRTSTFWKGEMGLQASVEDEGSSYQVRLYVKGSQIRDYSCSCVKGNSFHGMCDHAKLVWDKWQKEMAAQAGKPVSTSQEIRTMIREYTNREVAQIIRDQEEGQIRLIPRLILKNNEVSVEFKLGRSRFYVLRDLTAFVQAIDSGASVSYGKQLTFHHSIYAFAEEDRPLCMLLAELVHVYQEHYEQFRRSTFATVQGLRQLNLSRANRDRFFRLMEGQTLEVEFSSGASAQVMVSHSGKEGTEILPFAVSVDICRAGRDGIQVSVDPDTYGFPGEDCWYVGDRTRFVCLEGEASRQMGSFLEQVLKDRRSHTLTVQDRDIPLFYERVLQKILPYTSMNIKDVDLEQYRPQELKATFSFDSPRPGEITMKPVLSYGDFSFQPVEDEKVPRTICRDVPGEFRISQAITRYFKYRDESGETLLIRDDEEAMYRLLSEGMAEFMELGTVFVSEEAEKIRILPPPRVQVGVQTMGNWLELHVEAEGMTQAQLQQLLKNYQPKKPYYRLKTGEFLQLGDAGIFTVAKMINGMSAEQEKEESGTFRVPMYRALYLDSILKDGNGITFYRDNLFKAVVRGMKSVEDGDFEIPVSMRSVLRGYQKTGFYWMKTLDSYGFGGILADDMGLGKTVQVIALLLDEAQKNRASRFLIVCPASLVYNWENEINRFAPELKVQTVTGSAGERQEILAAARAGNVGEEPQIYITSYDLLKRDLPFYEGLSFRFQIIDEAQYIKNPSTQTARAVKMISSRTRFALTGTPIENRLSEFWSIFDYLMPGFLFSYGEFKKRFENPVVKDGDQTAVETLKRLTGAFLLRRLKKDVLKDLPEKLETVVYSRADTEQHTLYNAQALQLKQYLEDLDSDLGGSERLQILAQMTRLRQICCDPSLCFQKYRGGSAKLDTCMELISGGIEGGHKMLVFSQFTSMLEVIEKRLKKEGISYYLLTGGTSKEERIRMAGAFQTDSVPVFLISLKAGGTGLNLTAADMVIHYDPWWNAAAQNQATDRTHRIGQEKQVTVFQMIMKDTIEENIMKLQAQKKDLADQIISGERLSLSSLTKEELLKLLL